MLPKNIPLLLLVVLSSCSTLKKSQIQATENYALATKGISRVPSDIYFRIYQLKSESQSLQANTLLAINDNANESIEILKNDYEESLKFVRLAEEYSTAYMIVEEYAGLVLSLIRQDYLNDFKKTRGVWQASFDKLIKRYNSVSVNKIPSSVGSFTASVIQAIGKLSFGSLQKKYLRQALHTAREPFENICQDFVTLDSLKIRSELNTLPAHLDNNYSNFLENVRAYETQGNNPFDYFHSYAPIYTNWLRQLDEIREISKYTLPAFRQLKVTYGALEEYVDGNGSTNQPVAIDSLMVLYSQLAGTYLKFENRKEKLTAARLLKN